MVRGVGGFLWVCFCFCRGNDLLVVFFSFLFWFLARRWLDGMRLWHFTAAVFAACIMPQISALVANFSAWFGRGEGLSSLFCCEAAKIPLRDSW